MSKMISVKEDQADHDRKYVIGFSNIADYMYNDSVYTLSEAMQEVEKSGELDGLIIYEIVPAYRVKYSMEEIASAQS